MKFMHGMFGGSAFLHNADQVNHYIPLPPGAEAQKVVPDLPPHEHFKFHPENRKAFDARLPEYAGAALSGKGLPGNGSSFNVILV